MELHEDNTARAILDWSKRYSVELNAVEKLVSLIVDYNNPPTVKPSDRNNMASRFRRKAGVTW